MQGPGNNVAHRAGQGAEAPRSGLVAMLAAAEALGNASAAGNYTRRLAFAALAGEPWGLMGSRRLLYQMHAAAPAVRGLALDAVEQARAARTARRRVPRMTVLWGGPDRSALPRCPGGTCRLGRGRPAPRRRRPAARAGRGARAGRPRGGGGRGRPRAVPAPPARSRLGQRGAAGGRLSGYRGGRAERRPGDRRVARLALRRACCAAVRALGGPERRGARRRAWRRRRRATRASRPRRSWRSCGRGRPSRASCWPTMTATSARPTTTAGSTTRRPSTRRASRQRPRRPRARCMRWRPAPARPRCRSATLALRPPAQEPAAARQGGARCGRRRERARAPGPCRWMRRP